MKLYVPLTSSEFATLQDVANRQRRRPQDQAATILAEVLAASTTPSPPPAPASASRGIDAPELLPADARAEGNAA